MCVWVLSTHSYLERQQGISITAPGTGVAGHWELLFGCWKPSPGPLSISPFPSGYFPSRQREEWQMQAYSINHSPVYNPGLPAHSWVPRKTPLHEWFTPRKIPHLGKWFTPRKTPSSWTVHIRRPRFCEWLTPRKILSSWWLTRRKTPSL